MIIDSHCHIFTPRIVKNMQTKPGLVNALRLNVCDAWSRLHPRTLQESAETHGITACLLLPTAPPDRISLTNDRFIEYTKHFSRLRTLATLHPAMENISHEIDRILDLGIAGFKFSSFSQHFDILGEDFQRLLDRIERAAVQQNLRIILLFDTFTLGNSFFGTPLHYLTTPSRLALLVKRYPGLTFVAAHMGGLLADFHEVTKYLVPQPNLYLDTSNAAHTLQDNEFIELVRMHGPDHILFGTDWPWFIHDDEMPKIRTLLIKAGFGPSEQAKVFGDNAKRIFGFLT